MTILIAIMLFLQASTDPPAYMAQVVPDAVAGQFDLQFDDGTLWSMTFHDNCDWVTQNQRVAWMPFGSSTMGTINVIGTDQYCTTDTESVQ